MRKLSDIHGEEALDVLADIIDPATEIMADQNLANYVRSGQNIAAIRVAIKDHKKAVIRVLATLDGEDPETYKPGVLTLPIKLLEIINDPDVMQVFSLQGQKIGEEFSGSATASTTGPES